MIHATADRWVFKEPYEAPALYCTVKKVIKLSAELLKGSWLYFSQNSHQIFSDDEYCLTVPDDRDARVIWTDESGIPFNLNAWPITSLPPGKGLPKGGVGTCRVKRVDLHLGLIAAVY